MIRGNRWIWAAVAAVVMAVMQVAAVEAAMTHHVGTGQTFSTIQAGINAASPGDTVLVHDDTYIENIDFNGKAITVKSQNGPDVTTIDGSNPADSNKGSVVTFDQGEDSDSVLEGFKLTKGNGTLIIDGNNSFRVGGGINSSESSPKIINCIINGNSAKYGGGVLGYSSGMKLVNCIINNNSGEDGAGIYFINNDSSPQYRVGTGYDPEGNGYHIRPEVEVGLQEISSVTVSGPDYYMTGVPDYNTSSAPSILIYDNDSEWYTRVHIAGTPNIGDVFTFTTTFDDGTTEITTASITNYFTEAPTLVSPPDGAILNTLTPTLAWNNLSIPVNYYSVLGACRT